MNIKEAMKHPLVEYARGNLWGSATTTIPKESESDFDAMTAEDRQLVRAFFTGATTGCGVAESLANNPNYGPAYQEKRYTSVNTWFKWLKENLPPHLSVGFGAPVELRQKTGGISTFDADWLPEDKRFCLTTTSTYEGFVLPRLVIDLIDKPDLAFQMIDQASKETTILRAIATAAIFQLRNGIDPQEIKNRLFDESITLELHPDYWFPILSRLNRYLPQELKKDLI